MIENNPSAEIYWFIGFLGVIVLLLLLIRLAKFINDFSRELRYLNNEIVRTEGAEQRYYIRKRRRLWLSWLPFVKY